MTSSQQIDTCDIEKIVQLSIKKDTKVLIVDDVPYNIQALKILLKSIPLF